MAYTTIDDPSEYFNIVLYTGNQSTNAITNSANAGDFQPDWVWLKSRTSATHHRLYDSSRGVLQNLLSSLGIAGQSNHYSKWNIIMMETAVAQSGPAPLSF